MANIFDLFKQISSDSANSSGNVEYILAGLGNPGKEYEHTRHNAGFMAVDLLAKEEKFEFPSHSSDSRNPFFSVYLSRKRKFLLEF